MKELTLDEIHAALFDILAEFDRVCRENNLQYSLAYGTLLGAVRHRGFIPWDDDVDVYMPRPDYETFVSIAANVLKEPFSLAPDRGKDAQYPFCKVVDARYRIKSTTHREVPNLYIDIFPVDGVPADEKKRKKMYRGERALGFGLLLTKWYTVGKAGFLLRIFGFFVYLVGLCIGRRRFVAAMNRRALAHPYEDAELVGVHSWGLAREAIAKDSFEHYTELDFEGKKFFAVENYDELLTNCYGDYMTPPPPRKRITHSMRVFSD